MAWGDIITVVLGGLGLIGTCYAFAWWIARLCNDVGVDHEQTPWGEVVHLPAECRVSQSNLRSRNRGQGTHSAGNVEYRAARKSGGEGPVVGGRPDLQRDIAHRREQF